MRLLTIVSDSCRGGATFSFINLILGLIRKGVEVRVVTPCKGYLTDILDKNGIQYYVVSYGFSVWPFSQGRNIIKHIINYKIRERQAVESVKKIAKGFNPDIIHTNVSVVDVGYMVAKRLKIPHVWHIREYGDLDFDLHLYPSKRLFKNKLDKSWSIAITKDLKKYYGNKKRCRVIYNGIKDSVTSFKWVNNKEKCFIYVGRVTPNKGAEEVVKAFMAFGKINKEFKLYMFGSVTEEYMTCLKGIYSGTEVDGRIFFTGAVTDVDERMRRAWAIIVPSFYEGFGRITAEAMFNQCLVIGRNTAGTKEQLDNGVSICGKEIGIRFETIEDLTMAMTDASKMSISDIENYTLSAKNVVEVLYTNEKNVNETYEFLFDILKDRKCARGLL